MLHDNTAIKVDNFQTISQYEYRKTEKTIHRGRGPDSDG